MNKTGELIKKYRIARGISQFDLELEAGLGLGSIGKIEQGKVQPDKDDLLLIIKALGLSALEALRLYGINPRVPGEFAESIARIEKQKDLHSTLQECVNEMSSKLDIIGSAAYVVEGKKLYFKVTGENWFSQKLNAITDHYNNAISYEISPTTDNSIVKALNAMQLFIEKSMYSCTRPQMKRAISDLTQGITGIEKIAILPIINPESIAIGACTVAFNREQNLADNLPYFYQLTYYTGPLIARWL